MGRPARDRLTLRTTSEAPGPLLTDDADDVERFSSRQAARAACTKDKALRSLERRLRDVPQLECIALLNDLIAAAVEALAEER